MLHLIPELSVETSPVYAEAVARLASVRHALRLVDEGFAAGPSDEIDSEVAAAWPDAGEARQRWFDRRSAALIGTTATGIEALLAERQAGREPHVDANRTLLDEIRRELREVAGIILA